MSPEQRANRFIGEYLIDSELIKPQKADVLIKLSEALAQVIRESQAKTMYALEESVKLMSHYADLLNMYDDGGERLTFKDAQEWLDRLHNQANVS